MDVISALRQHSEAGAAIVDLLYGEMGEEVSKAITEFGQVAKLDDATKKKIAVGGNILGLTAGTAALGTEAANTRRKYKALKGIPVAEKAPATLRLSQKLAGVKHPALKPLARVGGAVARHPGRLALGVAGAGLGLQAANVGGDAVIGSVLNEKKPKNGVAKSVDEIEIFTEISKVDEDKRQIFGWASVTSINGQPVIDLQEDILPLEEIEKAAYDFVEKSRVGGNMHQKGDTGPIHVSDMIESFVVTPEKKKAMGLPDDFPEGWWTGFKVNDDATWADAKAGKLAGLSIHGSGRRIPVEAY
jgi:hypothetical protein